MNRALGARTWSASATDHALPNPKWIDERDAALIGLGLIAVLLVALLLSDRMSEESGGGESTTETKNTRHGRQPAASGTP